MIVLVHDGTPMGLATAAAYALRLADETGAGVSLASRSHFRPDLFAETRAVETDYQSATAFLRELRTRLPMDLWREVLVCFFAGEPDLENTLLVYIRLLLRTRGRAAQNWADGTVRAIRRQSGRVFHEIARLHGFVRFERLPGGLYYARVAPDHPILPLLAPHFAARFADQRWLIHDLKRNSGVYYDGRRWAFLPEVSFPTAPDKALAAPDPQEELCQEIWRAYFAAIAVEERRNPRLQRQRLPRRYWENMTEMREG